jgi:hypothetical protein
VPDAVIIEHPARYAGGHLGATRLEDVTDSRFDFTRVFEEVRKVLPGAEDSGQSHPAGERRRDQFLPEDLK